MSEPGNTRCRTDPSPPFFSTKATFASSFFQTTVKHFLTWYRTPATRKDRVLAAVVGGIGFFWIGLLGRITLGPMPVSLSTLGWWALASAATGVVLGLVFPKTVACVCYPFSVFGVSP